MMRLAVPPLAPLLLLAACAAASGEEVSVVSGGRSDWRIVPASRDPPVVAFAAGELQRYIRQMTGCELPIVPPAGEGTRGKSATREGGPAILLGVRADLSDEDRALLPPPAAGHDGVATAVRPARGGAPPRIVLAGEVPRGVAYAAYDLLERAGCRWHYPAQDPGDPEVVPRRASLAVEAGVRAAASPFRFRIANGSAWLFHVDLAAARAQLDWALKCRYNSVGWQSESKTSLASQYRRMREAGLLDALDRRGMLLHGPGHSFDHFLRAEDHMEKHPEWFGLRDGKRVPQTFFGAQFCWSNPEARHRFVDGVEAFARECPAIRILYIVPFDGGRCCECAECRRIGASNLLMVLLGEVIDRLRASAPGVAPDARGIAPDARGVAPGAAGVLVETVGGYEPVTEPPRGVAIHPDQRILWAHWGRYHGRSYADPAYERRENLETWRRTARAGLTVCQYYTDNFAEPWILPPFAGAIEGDRRWLVENGVDSVYVLMWPPGYWWNHGLNGYVAGRCFFDASLDPFREVRDHAETYFGPKAGPLLARYRDEWARDVDLAYRLRDGTGDGDLRLLAAERRDLIDPAAEAVRDDAVLSHRVAKVERLHALAERLAEAHRRRGEARRLREAGRAEEARRALDDASAYTEDLLRFFLSLAELDEGLVDRNEVPGFISLKLRGLIDEERKALGATPAGS